MPLLCPQGFDSCTTRINDRLRLRKKNVDGEFLHAWCTDRYLTCLQDATPGYFTSTLDNNIKMEATSTRRAGLERFTFPKGSKPYFVLDLANDLPASMTPSASFTGDRASN